MSESSRLAALNIGRSLPLRRVAGVVVATMFIVPVASRTAKAVVNNTPSLHAWTP